MADLKVGVDWNRDGVIYWGADSALSMIRVLSVNDYGTSDNGTVAPYPGSATSVSGSFTSSGFSLSWNAPTTGGTPDYYIILYENMPSGTALSTTYTKTYSTLEILENISNYINVASWQNGMANSNDYFPSEGQAQFSLINTDRTFSPSYSSSPLYEEAPIGARVVIYVQDSGTDYLQWTGSVTNINPQPTIRTPFTELVCSQGIDSLRNAPVDPTVQEDVNTGNALAFLLKNWVPYGVVGWNLGVSALGVSTKITTQTALNSYSDGIYTYEVFNETWMTAGDRDKQLRSGNTGIESTIENLVIIEDGLFFIDVDNSINFLDKPALTNKFSSATAFSIDSSAITADYSYGDDAGIYNIIKVNYYEKEMFEDELMFTFDDKRTVRGSETSILNVGKDSVDESKITPIAVTSGTVTYTGGTLADTYAINADATGVEVTLTSYSGTDSEVTKIEIYGDFLKSYPSAEVMVSDDTSIGLYGKREMVLDLKECATSHMAESIANRMLYYYSVPRGRFNTISLNDKNSTWLGMQLNLGISDALEVTEYQTGETNKPSYIVGKNMRWTPGLLETTFVLRDYPSNVFWVLGTSELENDTIII